MHASAVAVEASSPGGQRLAFWGAFSLFLLAGGTLYAVGLKVAGLVVAGMPIILGTLLYPQIGAYVYFALQAWDAALVSAVGAVVTPAKLFSIPFLIGFLVAAMRRPVHLRESRSFVILALVYAVWAFVPAAFSVAPLASVRFALQHIVQILLLVAVIHLVDTRERIGRLMFWTVVSGTAAAAIMFVYGGSRLYTRGTLGEYANPVSTALALGTAMMCIPAAWSATRTRWLYPCYIAAGVVMTIGILITGTRAVLIGVFLALGFGAMVSKRVSWSVKVFAGTGAGIVLVGVLTIVLASGVLDQQSQERFESLVTRTEAAGSENVRWAIWKNALLTYADHWVLGFGMGNTQFAMERKFGSGYDIHNSYLAPLVDTGPIGAALFWAAIVVVIRRVRAISVVGAGVPAMMMLVYVLFTGLTHTFHSTKWFWIPMTVCLLFAEHRHLFAEPTDEWGEPSTLDETGDEGYASWPRSGAGTHPALEGRP